MAMKNKLAIFAASALLGMSANAFADGKQTFDTVCFVCHAQGIAGAPKLGDKAAWEPRIAQGMDVLATHAINGFTGKTGTMPPKGGRMDVSDADVKAAIQYMVDQAK
jgi:cytochrome c5